MSNEEKIIKYFTKNYNKIGDDCAYLSQTKQLISSDTLVENIHFDLKYFTPKNIAHRLFTANYSDIQSSGGKPKYVLLNLSFPNKNFRFVNKIIKNFHRYCLKYGIEIIGGDTTASDKIFLSLTIISDAINKNKIIKMSRFFFLGICFAAAMDHLVHRLRGDDEHGATPTAASEVSPPLPPQSQAPTREGVGHIDSPRKMKHLGITVGFGIALHNLAEGAAIFIASLSDRRCDTSKGGSEPCGLRLV